jgi:outer membrane protein, heavy metal efflux system
MERIHWRGSKLRALILIVAAIVLVWRSSAGAQANLPQSLDGSSDLDALVREGTERNPAVIAAKTRWEALKRVPIQMRTLPDPQIQLQEFTVGSPKPAAGYETSNFYDTGIGASQEIPGPGKLRLHGEIAEQDAEVARHQYEAAQRETAEKIRESYFDLFYLTKTIGLLEAHRLLRHATASAKDKPRMS